MRPDRRTSLWLAVLALAFTGLGYVLGSARAPEPRGETYLQALARELSLRPEQVAAIDDVLAREDAELAELVAASRAGLREPVTARRRQTEDEMLSILDAEQRVRYEELSRP